MQIKDRVNNILSLWQRKNCQGLNRVPLAGSDLVLDDIEEEIKFIWVMVRHFEPSPLKTYFTFLLLKEILSEKANLLIINPTIAITNKLILPAIIPELIPIKLIILRC
jgi:hypothetical protein